MESKIVNDRRLKILFVTDQFPRFPGPAVESGLYCLVKELSRRHDVHIFISTSSHFEKYAEPLKKICPNLKLIFFGKKNCGGEEIWQLLKLYYRLKKNRVISISLRIIREIIESFSFFPARVKTTTYFYRPAEMEEYINRYKFDIIQVQHSYIGYWCANVDTGTKKVLYIPDVLTLLYKRKVAYGKTRLQRAYNFLEFKKMMKYEKSIFPKYDMSVVMTENEMSAFSEVDQSSPVSVIPLGIDTDFYSPTIGIVPQKNTLVYTGSFTYGYTLDAITYFCDCILSLIKAEIPDVKVSFVGPLDEKSEKVVRKYRSDSVIFTGWVPDPRKYFDSAEVYIAPLTMGTGIRVKILEAMSMKKAIVSTSIGCEGIECVDGEHLLIRDTPELFGAAVIKLLKDPLLRRRLEENGRSLIESKYSIQKIALRHETLYSKLCSNLR